MNVQEFLNRLDKVKKLAPDRWVACCPAHQDKHPSMNIKECSDGTILVICRTGCSTYDIMQSVGLELKDLFRQDFEPKQAFPAADVLEAIRHEVIIVGITANDMFNNRDIKAGDWLRLKQASRRIYKATHLTNTKPKHA